MQKTLNTPFLEYPMFFVELFCIIWSNYDKRLRDRPFGRTFIQKTLNTPFLRVFNVFCIKYPFHGQTLLIIQVLK